MNPIESMAWAILKFEGFYPGSRSWKNRNPGNLRASSLAYAIDHGYAVFDSFQSGWEALVHDLTAKFRGAPYTRTGIGPTTTLLGFFEIYSPSTDGNKPKKYAEFIAKSLSDSLKREITAETTLREIQFGPQ